LGIEVLAGVLKYPYIGQPEAVMLVLGVILLVLGFLLHISILWTIGIILVVIGAVLWIAGAMGRPVAGRRHYW
jgi:uncharacterized membrane protein HdeD (DUF308 family)